MKYIHKLVIPVVLTIFLAACSDTKNNSGREDTDSFTLEDKNINEVTLPDSMRDEDSI